MGVAMAMIRGWVIALLVVACVGASRAGAETVLALGHVLSPESHFGVAAAVMAEQVAQRTDGRYRIQIYPNGGLGGEREMLVGAQIGTLDLALVSTGSLGDFIPDALIIDIPFLFRDYGHARAVLDGPIGRDLLAGFPARGLIGLAWGENGFRHLTTRDRPVSRLADLRGLTLRTQQNPVHQLAFGTLGAKTIPLPFPALYEALQTHTVDGEDNSIPVILDAKLAEVQKYLTLSAHVYSATVFIMTPNSWRTLDETDRAAFIESARLAGLAQRAEVDRLDQAGLAALRAGGMRVTEGVDRAAFLAALAPAYYEYGKMFGRDRIYRIRDSRP